MFNPHTFFSKINQKQIKKINFFSYKIWRAVYLITLKPVTKVVQRRIRTRSSTIPEILLNTEVFIYSGKRWHKKNINKWMIGFKFGEFTWNRRYALYKAKQLRKKNKKKK